MSETTILVLFLVGVGVPFIAGAVSVYFLWQTRNKTILTIILIGQVVLSLAVPVLGYIAGISLFFTPYAEGYKPQKNSFNDAFADKD